MKYLKPILIAILVQIVALFAPVLVLVSLPFIKWDKEQSTDFQGNNLCTRGDLPRWLSWLSTPDERLPGGLYEDTVRKVHVKYGKYICSLYWLGLRNRVHGFAMIFGEEVSDFWPEAPGYYSSGKFWWIRRPFLNNLLSFKAGYRVYSILDGRKIAVPCFTVTRL